MKGEDRLAREMLMGGISGGMERSAVGDKWVVMVRALIQWGIEKKIILSDPGDRRMTDALKKMGMTKDQLKIRGSAKPKEKCWVVPPLAEARETWAKNMGLDVDWPDVDDWTAFNPTSDH